MYLHFFFFFHWGPHWILKKQNSCFLFVFYSTESLANSKYYFDFDFKETLRPGKQLILYQYILDAANIDRAILKLNWKCNSLWGICFIPSCYLRTKTSLERGIKIPVDKTAFITKRLTYIWIKLQNILSELLIIQMKGAWRFKQTILKACFQSYRPKLLNKRLFS